MIETYRSNWKNNNCYKIYGVYFVIIFNFYTYIAAALYPPCFTYTYTILFN